MDIFFVIIVCYVEDIRLERDYKMKKQVVKRIGIIMIMSLMLVGCGKSEVSTSESKEDTKEYESEESSSTQSTSTQSASTVENTVVGREVYHIEENIDVDNLPDGTYPVRLIFDDMKRNEGSLSIDFMIYTVAHYDPETIRDLTRDDIVYEYVDETTTENYLIDTVNFPLDEVCVINGGSERGEGLTLSLDESGFFRVTIQEVYTRNISHGIATLEIPDTVSFSDNFDLTEKSLSGEELYNYFDGLSDSEKEYFNENNTFLTVSNGKVADLHRIYLP